MHESIRIEKVCSVRLLPERVEIATAEGDAFTFAVPLSRVTVLSPELAVNAAGQSRPDLVAAFLHFEEEAATVVVESDGSQYYLAVSSGCRLVQEVRSSQA